MTDKQAKQIVALIVLIGITFTVLVACMGCQFVVKGKDHIMACSLFYKIDIDNIEASKWGYNISGFTSDPESIKFKYNPYTGVELETGE